MTSRNKKITISLNYVQSNVFCEAAEFYYTALAVIKKDKSVEQRIKALEEIETLFNSALVAQGIMTAKEVQEQMAGATLQ